MITLIKRWIFKKEHKELQSLINKAKECSIEKPVQYKVFDTSSKPFLFAMSELSSMSELRFWILERQRQADQLIKYSPSGNRDFNIGRSMGFDELLGDLKRFKEEYQAILEMEQRIQDAKV
jgi:hypothetical protein